MDNYDVVIVGGATTGSYFAHELAVRGHSVLVIEKKAMGKVGKYDIYHMTKREMDAFGLPHPEKGDDWAFEFCESVNLSAYGNYPKKGGEPVIGMHMPQHTYRLERWAMDAGATFVFEAEFTSLVFDENGKICGIKYNHAGETVEVRGKLVADCSGIPSVVRRSLPDQYGVENFEIGPDDMFYVNLRYVKYQNPRDYVKKNRSWTYYKTWEAPQADPHGAILGVGANFSSSYADKIFDKFEKTVSLPKYTVERIERGTTPYRRPPYSMVSDGFIAMGDAACLTKPSCGEGVTSSMVQAKIAWQTVDKLLRQGKPLTRENLWPINKKYVNAQGRAFASQLATVSGAVATSPKENDFFFKKDIIFSEASFEALGRGEELKFSNAEIAKMAVTMAAGVISGQLRIKTIKALLKAMKDGDKISAVYAKYPNTPEDFEAWTEIADAAWSTCTDMTEAAKAAEE